MILVEVSFETVLVKPICSSLVRRTWFFCLPNEGVLVVIGGIKVPLPHMNI